MASSISLIHVVECPVCLLKYDLPDRVPKILGCGHTFCLCCLRELGSGGDIQCPTCRAQYNIPLDGKVEGKYINMLDIGILHTTVFLKTSYIINILPRKNVMTTIIYYLIICATTTFQRMFFSICVV